MSDATTLPTNTKDFCDIESKTSDYLAVVRGHELTDAERAQFDHLDWSFDGEGWHGRYVRFCGIVYRLDVIKPLPASLPEWFGDSYEGVVSSPNGPDIAICWAPDENIEADYTRVRVGVLVAAPTAKPTDGNGKHGPRLESATANTPKAKTMAVHLTDKESCDVVFEFKVTMPADVFDAMSREIGAVCERYARYAVE